MRRGAYVLKLTSFSIHLSRALLAHTHRKFSCRLIVSLQKSFNNEMFRLWQTWQTSLHMLTTPPMNDNGTLGGFPPSCTGGAGNNMSLISIGTKPSAVTICNVAKRTRGLIDRISYIISVKKQVRIQNILFLLYENILLPKRSPSKECRGSSNNKRSCRQCSLPR